MAYRIISMFTTGTPYEQVAKTLENSLNILQEDYILYPIPNLKDWVKNCLQKPAVILRALTENPNHDIVFVDADAVVLKKPVLFNQLDCDIAFFYDESAKQRRFRLCSGTLFFKNNYNSRRLILEWQDINQKSPTLLDQENLLTAVENLQHMIKVEHLPYSYCKIFDKKPDVEAHILHTQKSRLVKRGVWKL